MVARAALAAIALCCHGGALHAQDLAETPDGEEAGTFAFGGQLQLAFEREQNFDLDGAEDDALNLFGAELQLEFGWRPNPYFAANVLLTARQEYELPDRGGGAPRDTELLVEDAWITLSAPAPGLSLELGRQPFEDRRQWWYDADLDAARLTWRRPELTIEASVSREALVQQDLLNSNQRKSADNYIVHASYRVAPGLELGAYGIVSDRGDSSDRRVFAGLDAYGRPGDPIEFWGDAALLRGEESGQDLEGFGIDLLGAWHLELPLAPRLILGYAFGSGSDGAFRQTGLQGNEATIGGLVPFHYYGELLDPELSNLSILTTGIGATPLDNLSLDLLLHHYRQDKASDEARDWALDAEPSGEHRRLGNELDLVLGFLPLEDLQLSAFLGWFMPGNAFADQPDDAFFVRLEAQYEF
jgi:alginate production protein